MFVCVCGGVYQHEGDCAVNAPQEEKTRRRFAAVSGSDCVFGAPAALIKVHECLRIIFLWGGG